MPKDNNNQEYRVVWKIDICADSLLQAAREALDIQQDPESLAKVFKIWNKAHPQQVYQVDLLEEKTPVKGPLPARKCCGKERLINMCRDILLREDISDDEIGNMIRQAIAKGSKNCCPRQ